MSMWEVVVAMAGITIYAAYKVTTFAVKGAAKLLYHGGKAAVAGTKAAAAGVSSASAAIREAHAAAEEKRREEALAELKAMDGAMARSTESLLADIRRAEAAAEKERAATAAAMDKRWASALAELEGKADHADEAMLALHEFHTKKAVELDETLRTETAALESRLTTAVSDLTAKTVAKVTATTQAAIEAVDKAAATIEERTARYEAYARQTLAEAEEMLAWLEKHYDCDTYAEAQLVSARAKIKSTQSSLASGAFKGAAGSAALAASEVQMLYACVEQRTSAFNRAKAELQAASAELMDIAEASRTLLEEGDPEELAEFVTEEYDANFWSDGRLKMLWEDAAALQARAEALTYTRGYSDEADALALDLARARQALLSEYTRTRLHVVSRLNVIQFAQTTIESYQENGWEMVEAPSYTRDDPRSELHLAFVRGGTRRDVFVRNLYDQASGMYKQEILCHVEEDGIPDEEERREDRDATNASMKKRGVTTGASCVQSTAGLSGPVDPTSLPTFD